MASEYAMMLQNSAVAFKDPELKKSTIKRDPNGQPFGMAGAFAVVYKATLAAGGHRAVRAFTSARDGRGDSYRAISDYLARHKHIPSLVEFQYADKGIRGGDGKFYPLVTMEWVEGSTLFDWVHHQCTGGNAQSLRKAVDGWTQLIEDLASAQIAHGDLQHANVMVTQRDELKLVDYDCMCVPDLVGRPNLEIGVEPYQHPQRDASTVLTSSLDNFSGIFIYVALRALAGNPRLWIDYVERHKYDKLLIRKEDFQNPDGSALFGTLRGSSDDDLGRIAKDLWELYRADIGKVPNLRELLFSFDKVRSLLTAGQFRAAVELVNRNRSGRQPPADLESDIQTARKRVECLDQLQGRVKAGDMAAAQTLAGSPLLRNFPEAAPIVQEVQLSIKTRAWIAQFEEDRKRNAWRDFVSRWDKGDASLKARPEAAPLKAEVEKWRKQNAAWDTVQVEYRKSPLDWTRLAAAWKQLQTLGGHPEATVNKAKVELTIARHEAWGKWSKLPRGLSQANDEALVDGWNEKLFKDWSIAEAERENMNQAARRRTVARELEAMVAALPNQPSLEDEERLLQAAEALPDGYAHRAAQRVTQARDRIRVSQVRSVAHRKFKRLIEQADSESAIVAAWSELQQAGALDLATETEQKRVKLAQQRLPLLQRLRALGNALTTDQMDRQLLAIWQPTLESCAEASPWQGLHNNAIRRKDLLKEFGLAIEREDDDRLVALLQDPLLAGYPLPREWAALAAAAVERSMRAQNLVEALQNDQRALFREQFDRQVFRRSFRMFEPYLDLLRDWIRTEILPCRNIGLAKTVGVSSLVKVGGSYRARWKWPTPQFCDTCLVGVCRSVPKPNEDPRALKLPDLTTLTKRKYEDAGGRIIHPAPDWSGCYVIVWAVVDVGFESFVSEPFVLGRLDGAPASSSGSSTNTRKRNWGIL